MLYADLMISTACDGDRPSYARTLMTVGDAIREYEEVEARCSSQDESGSRSRAQNKCAPWYSLLSRTRGAGRKEKSTAATVDKKTINSAPSYHRWGGEVNMKSTGIVRRIDDLGRIVIPKELRRTLGIGEKDPLEIFTDGQDIVLRKYAPGCTICGETEVAKVVHGKPICGGCVEAIRE